MAILSAVDYKIESNGGVLTNEHEATLNLALIAYHALPTTDSNGEALGSAQEIAALQSRLLYELKSYAKKYDPTFLTKIPAIAGQDETIAGNLANWGSTTIETGLLIDNNNGGTVAGPALQIASFANNQALLVTTTAGINIAQISTNNTQPGLSLASTAGTFANAASTTRFMVNGPAVHASSNGTALTVTGNSSSPAILSVGNGTTIAPALQIINNPVSTTADFNATIDSLGMVKQSTTSIQNQFILNGGQAGPLTFGTTNASSLSFITNNNSDLTIDQSGNTIFTGSVTIGTSASVAQVTIVQNSPSVIGSLSTGATGRNLAIQGRYVYVVNPDAGTLQIFDASTPSNPTLVSTTSTVGGSPYGIYVYGRYAYVVNLSSNTLVIFDISNPATPVIVNGSGTATGNEPTYIYVQGRYAYITNQGDGTLQIFDITYPSVPISVGISASTGQLYHVYVQGRYAYVTNIAGFSTGNLQVFDVSNPAAPTLVNTPSAAPTGSGPVGIYVQGRYAYLVNFSSASFQIFDVSNPVAPQLVNVVGTTVGTDPFNVVVQGRYAYITNYNSNTVQFLDVSNPAMPVSMGTVAISGPIGLAVQGRYAYVVASGINSLQIIDLGGAYAQQLEVGSLEVGTLATRENMTINNDIDIKGGAVIGRALNVSGNVGALSLTSPNGVIATFGIASAPAYGFINTNTSTGMYAPAINELSLSSYGQDRLLIDSTGSVTQKSVYKVHAYRSSAQTVANATAAIIFDTEVFDPNNNFNTTTGTYTVPVTGTYLIAANVGFTIASATTSADVIATRSINIAVGGVAQTGHLSSTTPGYTIGGLASTAGSTGPYFVKTVGILQLTAGQTVTITYTTTRTDSVVANDTHLSIHYVSF